MAKKVSWNDDELARQVDLGSFSKIVVNEYERALVIKKGQIQNSMKPGKYKVTKLLSGSTKVVFVSLQDFKLKIGIGGVLTEDNVEAGCYGEIELGIDDAEMFYSEVLGDSKSYSKDELKDYIESDIQAFLRSEIAEYEAKELYKKNDVFVPRLRSELSNFFAKQGIDFKNITIQGIKLPDDIKEALQSKKAQEIEIDKEKKRENLEDKKKRNSNERMIEKYKKLKEAGIDVSDFKEKEIAEKDPEVLIEKYRAESGEKDSGSNASYCPSCGAELEEDAKFCHQCGEDVSNIT
jgi:regulator of protease activity HflC (stomatin/prohibitin superfamily)